MKEDGKKTMSHVTRREFIKYSTITAAGITFGSACFGPFVARAQKKPTLVIKFATSRTKEDKLASTGAFEFAEDIEKATDGEIKVEVYGAGVLGDQRVMAEKCQAGMIEMATTSPQNLSQLVPALNVLDFPYMWSSVDKYYEAVDSEYAQKTIYKKLEEKGLKVQVWSPSYFRGLGQGKGFAKPAVLPEEIKGKKIRVTGSDIERKTFDILGAAPTPVSWPECYTAMSQGTVDGLNVGIPSLHGAQIHETLKYFTKTDFMMNADLSFMSLKWFEKLPADHQKIIMKVGRESMLKLRKSQVEKNKEVEEIWKKRGIQIIELTPEQRQKWVNAVGHQLPSWDDLKQKYDLDVYNGFVKFAS